MADGLELLSFGHNGYDAVFRIFLSGFQRNSSGIGDQTGNAEETGHSGGGNIPLGKILSWFNSGIFCNAKAGIELFKSSREFRHECLQLCLFFGSEGKICRNHGKENPQILIRSQGHITHADRILVINQ